ncbi:hypothetical protein BGZ91_011510 [Linnemannia elongata]|nr:hypothetical protein BGZ91_011510 [Linnemannia elongata]KAG0074470.1 hypothetical protein BGZ90_010743 [Linnemannia elongata]
MKEKELLASFLVGSELHDSVSFTKFTSYFPANLRTHPEVKDLYRAYMTSRHNVRNKVKRNIEIEARRNPFYISPQQVQEQERERERDGRKEEERDDELMALEGFEELEPEDMDYYMELDDVDKYLTLDKAIQELAVAEKIYKKEVEKLERECTAIAQEFQDLDLEVNSVKVPNQPFEGVNEAALASDLQSLIAMCDALTSEAANAKK